MIHVRDLTRVFKTYKKRPGFWGGVRGLFQRDYEQITAADKISFDIAEGEFVGFLGPNGSGKTTTLKMLAGLIHPTSGEARVAGFIPRKRENAYRRLFALVLGQKNQLWWDLPARESFILLRHIYGIPRRQFDDTLGELSELLGVTPKLGVMVRELSLGERMKMELVAALLHRPKVLFLDEPTIGLDIVSQRAVRGFLRDYNRRHRVTILLTSHYMSDIKELCERVIVINKGVKIHDGPLAGLENAGGRRKIIRLRTAVPEVFRRLVLETDPAATFPAPGDDAPITLRVPADTIVGVSQRLLAAGPVDDITIEELPLEDVIEALFKRGA